MLEEDTGAVKRDKRIEEMITQSVPEEARPHVLPDQHQVNAEKVNGERKDLDATDSVSTVNNMFNSL